MSGLSNIFFYFDLKKANKMIDLFFRQIFTTKNRMVSYLWTLWKIMEFSALFGSHGWEACCLRSTCHQWNQLLQLQFNIQNFSVCFDQCELQFPIHGCVLSGKNFGQRHLQKLWIVRENGEGFFRFSTTNIFDRKKEGSSLFLRCWRRIHWIKNITKFLSVLYLKRPIERIFNYHQCWIRRLVENVFGNAHFSEYYVSPCWYNQKKLNLL